MPIKAIDQESLKACASELLVSAKLLKAILSNYNLEEIKTRLEQIRDDAIAALEYVEMYCK